MEFEIGNKVSILSYYKRETMTNMAVRMGYLENSRYTSGTAETVDLPIE